MERSGDSMLFGRVVGGRERSGAFSSATLLTLVFYKKSSQMKVERRSCRMKSLTSTPGGITYSYGKECANSMLFGILVGGQERSGAF